MSPSSTGLQGIPIPKLGKEHRESRKSVRRFRITQNFYSTRPPKTAWSPDLFIEAEIIISLLLPNTEFVIICYKSIENNMVMTTFS